jgi:tetratricopeptide (TPR) repeat protein
MPTSHRPLTLSVLALWKGLSQKEIGAGAGLPQKQVSYYLKKKDLDDDVYARLLRGVGGEPAEVHVVTGCLEALAALQQDGRLTPDEKAIVEEGVLEGSKLLRKVLTEAAWRSRELPPLEVYPAPADLETLRWYAGELWALLAPLPEAQRLARVRESPQLQTWALAERVCEESIVQASRDVERAASLARLAQEIAERMQGPEGWRRRVQGLATAHAANALRVRGELREAEAILQQAQELWDSGSDPDGVLDPGRLLDLEASLRRDQRRFEEALSLLDKALEVGRTPERYLVKMGFTLEVMGEYERAVEALRRAEPLVERKGDARLMNILRLNLAWDFCHLGRFAEADAIGQRVRAVAAEMGDEILILRGMWLAGRIAAGMGRSEEARELLRQARRGFAARGMGYDVALAVLEEAALLLSEGRTAEVRALTPSLAEVFESRGIHREALAALRLFQEAAEREEATVDLARRVLGYLFRARYDQGLRFE